MKFPFLLRHRILASVLFGASLHIFVCSFAVKRACLGNCKLPVSLDQFGHSPLISHQQGISFCRLSAQRMFFFFLFPVILYQL